jgi:hypothetical protein
MQKLLLSSRRRTPKAGSRSASGFTLVELMVALSGGLFLSMVVFALARDSTRFYQREGRVASATLAGIVGFKRLTDDIARAGFLSTPNIQSDPRNCTPANTLPPGLQTLAAVRITPDTPDLSGNGAYALNASSGQIVRPDQIVLSGSYGATDAFVVMDLTDGTNITLSTNTSSMARIGYNSTSNVSDQAVLLRNVFGVDPGQILRIQDLSGHLYFGQIASVSGGPSPTITLAAPLPFIGTNGGTCGLSPPGTGAMANVVNVVRYRVMDLQNDAQGAAWAPLFASSQGASGETTRTELVRDQLSVQGATIANTTDIAAEYAVDLEFSVLGQTTPGNPALTLATPGDGFFATFFQSNGLGDRPQGVRAVRVRLSVRSREADRSTAIAGGLYRFQVGASEWARVRTFQTDVALPNLREVTW